MKLCKKQLPGWIAPYATIIGNHRAKDNPSELTRLLHSCIPNLFEAYAIILHSFEVNKEEKTWEEIFRKKKRIFHLEKILRENDDQYMFRDLSSENGEIFPGEGLMDDKHIESLKDEVVKIYGNEEIETFYIHLATVNWESNKIYEGRISEVSELKKNKNLRLTPSLIYSKNKNWVVNSDYDLPCSFIGGSQELVESLTKKHPQEIYQIEY